MAKEWNEKHYYYLIIPNVLGETEAKDGDVGRLQQEGWKGKKVEWPSVFTLCSACNN